MVIWLILTLFGLSGAVVLSTNQTMKLVLPGRSRGKYAAGYLLGALGCGLITFGLRFFPLMPPLYFVVVGVLVLISVTGFLFWSRRQTQPEEIFP